MLSQRADNFTWDITLLLQHYKPANSSEENYVMKGNVLCHTQGLLHAPHLVLPRSLIESVISSFHDNPLAGHPCATETFHRLQKRFWWPMLQRNTQAYVKLCPTCQARKTVPFKPTMDIIPITHPHCTPFEMIGIDHIGLFSCSDCSKCYMTATMDCFTEWMEVFSVLDTLAFCVVRRLLSHIIL